MNDIQIFSSEEFGQIRTVTIDSEPWFVANDVGKALKYSDPRTGAKKLVDDEDKLVVPLDSAGQTRQVTIINESGLYSMIFGSKLDSAKKFKKWVTSEVLPSIRKHGTYTFPQTTQGQIQLLAQGYTEIKEEVDSIRTDLESLKMDLPILPVEADRITEAVRKKGVSILGGKQSKAYNERGLRQRVYNNLYGNLKYNFGVKTYKSLKRSSAIRRLRLSITIKCRSFLQSRLNRQMHSRP